MKGSRKGVFKISNIAACPLMRALRERETSADERGTAAVAGFWSGCLEVGPRAKSPGVVLVGRNSSCIVTGTHAQWMGSVYM